MEQFLENQPEVDPSMEGKTFADTLATEDLDGEIYLDDLPV